MNHAPSFAAADAERIEALRELIAQGGRFDGDAHVTDPAQWPPALAQRLADEPDYFHGRPLSAEELLAEMDVADVAMALIWQNPAATRRGPDRADNFAALADSNRAIALAAARWPRRFVPGGWTDPAGLGVDEAKRMVDLCVDELGFRIVKINPAQNAIPMDGAEVRAVTEHIVARGALPAFHVGGDTPWTPASALEGLARVIAPYPLIAVHMGGGGSGYVEGDETCRAVREVGLRQENIHFVQSAKRDSHIESDLIRYRLAGPAALARIGFGSDAPYGKLAWNFGGAEAMIRGLRDDRHPDPRLRAQPGLFTEADARGLLGGNVARLLLRFCEARRG